MSNPIRFVVLLTGFVMISASIRPIHAQPLTVTFDVGPSQFTNPGSNADFFNVGVSGSAAFLYPVHARLALTGRASGVRFGVNNGTTVFGRNIEAHGGSLALFSLSTGAHATTPRLGSVRGLGIVTAGIYRTEYFAPTYSGLGAGKIDSYGSHGWWNVGLHLQVGIQAPLTSTSAFFVGPSFTHPFKAFPGRPSVSESYQYLALRGGIGFQL
jgi:hypothetical protein